MFNKKVRTINPEIDITGFPFVKAAEGVGIDGLVCWGYMLYTSKFGKGVALVANDGKLYNLPSRYVAEFENISDSDREFVMSGKPLAFREYTAKSGNVTIIASIDGMDI